MDNRKNEHISKALEIAKDLIALANNADVLGNDNVCGILLGVMRDCGYKIRRQVEREHQGRKAKSQWRPCVSEIQQERRFNLKKSIMILGAVLILCAAVARPVNATIILSTNTEQTLGGLSFGNDDLAEYDPTTDVATLFLDGSLLTGTGTNIDGAHILESGNIILSTTGAATLGGLSFGKGDLIEYNSTTDTSTLFLDGALFSGNVDIDAAYINGSANIILSTTGNATLGGLSFGNDDLIEYNPTTDVATLFLDGNLLTGTGTNIDAAHILESGNIILSTTGAATLGGLSFGDGDLAEYNPTTDVATLYFDESLFSNNANIDGVYVTPMPEPATIALLGLGCLVLIRRRRK